MANIDRPDRSPTIGLAVTVGVLDVRDGACAFRLAVERDIPGCHVINVMAPDTNAPEPTAELWPAITRRPSSYDRSRGRAVPFDLTRSRELLDFEAEHLLPR